MTWPEQLIAWLRAGGPALPLIAVVALALHTLVAARAIDLWGLDPARLPVDPAARRNRLRRGLAVIRVLAGVLPLLGLVAAVPTWAAASPTAIAAGTGQTLIATQYALAAAIPALLAEWALRRRARALAGGGAIGASGVAA